MSAIHETKMGIISYFDLTFSAFGHIDILETYVPLAVEPDGFHLVAGHNLININFKKLSTLQRGS